MEKTPKLHTDTAARPVNPLPQQRNLNRLSKRSEIPSPSQALKATKGAMKAKAMKAKPMKAEPMRELSEHSKVRIFPKSQTLNLKLTDQLESTRPDVSRRCGFRYFVSLFGTGRGPQVARQ